MERQQENKSSLEIKKILEFFKLSERLKFELRHSWLSNGKQESVAEHVFQAALMAIMMTRHLEHEVNIERVLKMILLHDLVEAKTGDIPYMEKSVRQNNKKEAERVAATEIAQMLSEKEGVEFLELWTEFENRTTPEAKFATALDNLEVQFQHNIADFKTWEPVECDLVYTKMAPSCKYDAFLEKFCEAIISQAEEKMKDAGVDIEEVKKRVGA